MTRPAFPVQVIDTVGAGDAFMSGLLDALARRGLAAPQELGRLADATVLGAVLDDAAVMAAITCGRVGADPPTRAAVDEFVARHAGGPAGHR